MVKLTAIEVANLLEKLVEINLLLLLLLLIETYQRASFSAEQRRGHDLRQPFAMFLFFLEFWRLKTRSLVHVCAER